MHSLSQLQKQQVGLRLPNYLLTELDELTKAYSLNRSEVIIEAIESYIEQQKTQLFYQEFEARTLELKQAISCNDNAQSEPLQTLDDLIHDLGSEPENEQEK